MDAIDVAVQKERAFIAGCDDVHDLLDRMADYRDAERTAIANGMVKARLRIADLLELAEKRIAAIKLRELRRERVRAPPAPQRRPEVARAPEVRLRESTAPRSRPRADAWAENRQDHAGPERRPGVPDRLRPVARREVEPLQPRREFPAAGSEPLRESPVPPQIDHAAAERLRRMEAELDEMRRGRERAERERREAEARAVAAEKSAKQIDELQAQLRAEREAQEKANLERRAAEEAAADRERELRAKQAELERAMEEQRTRATVAPPAVVPSREQETLPDPMPFVTASSSSAKPTAPTPRPTVQASATEEELAVAHAASVSARPRSSIEPQASANSSEDPASASKAELAQKPVVQYTGADLARFRAERGLTQKAAGEILGVVAGTISKAERDADKPVGQALQRGLRRARET